jgi:hypothetical protein
MIKSASSNQINWGLFDAVSPLGVRKVDLPREYISCSSCGHSSMPINFVKCKCPNCEAPISAVFADTDGGEWPDR